MAGYNAKQRNNSILALRTYFLQVILRRNTINTASLLLTNVRKKKPAIRFSLHSSRNNSAYLQ